MGTFLANSARGFHLRNYTPYLHFGRRFPPLNPFIPYLFRQCWLGESSHWFPVTESRLVQFWSLSPLTNSTSQTCTKENRWLGHFEDVFLILCRFMGKEVGGNVTLMLRRRTFSLPPSEHRANTHYPNIYPPHTYWHGRVHPCNVYYTTDL